MKAWKKKTIFAAALLFCLLPIVAAEAANEDIVRLGVMQFTSKADGISDRQAEIITDIFTRVLTNSKTISVMERERLDMIGREQHLNMSGLVDMGMAVEVGRIAGLQYMLLGSVTELSEIVSGGFIPLGGIGLATGSHQARATIDMRVVDVTTSEIVLSLSETGSSTEEAGGISFGGIVVSEAEFGGIQARALTAAASRLGHKIREELGGEYSHVLSADGRNIQVSLGATSGAKEGDLYLVYADGKPVYDLDGTVIEREKLNIAALKMTDVHSGYSVGSVVPEGGNPNLIQRGDKIEPLSKERAKELAKRKAFVKDRPKAVSEARNWIENSNAAPAVSTLFSVDESDTHEVPVPAISTPPTDENAQQQRETPSSPVSPEDSTPPSVPARADRAFENQSTDPAKVIPTYPINSGEANTLRIAHINAKKLKDKNAYEKYVELADAYNGDYLAAYEAGERARKLKKKDEAADWFDKSLAINPDYKPALDARDKLD
jgi:curli biogenesis system outer membrane secretion channel CsgG